MGRQFPQAENARRMQDRTYSEELALLDNKIAQMGGMAEQLTFGPSYNSDPAFSPDGSLLAFVSDRDRSDGNIFILDLGSGDVTRVTSEQRAARPVWTPDGQHVIFASDRDEHWNLYRRAVDGVGVVDADEQRVESAAEHRGVLDGDGAVPIRHPAALHRQRLPARLPRPAPGRPLLEPVGGRLVAPA